MKWTLGIAGAIVGFVGAVVFMLGVFAYTPGMPGRWELLLQLVIVGYISGAVGVIGFGIGCIIDLCVGICRKTQDHG